MEKDVVDVNGRKYFRPPQAEENAPSSCTVDSLVGASDKRMDRLLAKVESLITRETRHLTAAEAGDVIDYICEELGHYKEGL